jgi:hypothetical protein
MSTRCISRVKAARAWCRPPTLYSAEVKEIVELYIYSTSGPLWTVLDWTLPWNSREQSFKTFLAFHRPRRFVAVFTAAASFPDPHTHMNSVHTLLNLFLSIYLNTIFTSMPSSSFGHFRSGFQIKAQDAYLFSLPPIDLLKLQDIKRANFSSFARNETSYSYSFLTSALAGGSQLKAPQL